MLVFGREGNIDLRNCFKKYILGSIGLSESERERDGKERDSSSSWQSMSCGASGAVLLKL